MHDFCKGMIPFTITNVSRAFALISPEFGIDACLINSRIESFQYCFYDIANKPSEIFPMKNSKGQLRTMNYKGKLFNTPER
jgi:hypothetical protein